MDHLLTTSLIGLNVVGTSVGTEADMASLLKLAKSGKVKARYEVFEFKDINEVAQKLAAFKIGGRAVLSIPQ